MKVPLFWFKEYLPTRFSIEEIADTLTTIGLECEASHDGVMEIALTPNLIHCASIRGMAKELAAATGETVLTPHYTISENPGEFTKQETSVTIENTEACPRYACRLIKGVQVAPSPPWLKEKIEQCGMRSVNNIVDVTNLVLLEFGQPLHAFDFDRLIEKRIIVRNARANETITTLDGKSHYLTEETLLVCDAQRPIAVAGIMGSLDTEVTETTTTILLESAYFEPSQIRRTCKRMDIRSEASYRFERGVDPNGILEALARATAFICQIAEGKALEGYCDIKTQEFPLPRVQCRLSRINQVLGTKLARGEVETIFTRLGFHVESGSDDHISVKIPTYRIDIHQEIDLIEEVARLYGYDNIYKKERALYRTGNLPHSSEYLFSRSVRNLLLKEGLQEC
jgi:phenylalanyl-tRNA synthetase beta chain